MLCRAFNSVFLWCCTEHTKQSSIMQQHGLCGVYELGKKHTSGGTFWNQNVRLLDVTHSSMLSVTSTAPWPLLTLRTVNQSATQKPSNVRTNMTPQLMLRF